MPVFTLYGMVSSCASTDIKIERDFGFSISFVNSSFSIPNFSKTTIVFLVIATSLESSRAIFDVKIRISRQTHVDEELVSRKLQMLECSVILK